MIAWTVLSILILLPSCSARPAPRKSYTEMFKCKLNFISMDEAQKAVQLGCKQMELAPPTSRFPASFIESELFDLTNIVLFTWPVFTSENVLREDYGINRVVFDSSCRIVGLIQIEPNGPKPCLHLMEAEELEIAYNLKIYNVPWKSLPLYGYRFEDEIYLKNAVEEFVESNFRKFYHATNRKNLLSHYPIHMMNVKAGVLAQTIHLGSRGIEMSTERCRRRLIVNPNKEVIGISRKGFLGWKPLSELRSLDDAHRMKVFLEREPDIGNEPLNDINYKGVHLSAAMLKSNLQIACKVFTEKQMGANLNMGYPMLTTFETMPHKPILSWPLRMPENFVRGGISIWLVLDAECNLMGVST
ncbi:BgtA-20962 [Blumeria graminis f. sp. tritici]|uniref:BgtA-20962 n=4 Tax=Blumeria graminis TaxID=34373 RepID=A0A9X9L7A6_BLUGR|nr:BgtA-20962 [Blumeria graminis f. sp. tritici]